jgi:hypothetical protein
VECSHEASNRGLGRRLWPVCRQRRGPADRQWRSARRQTIEAPQPRAIRWGGSQCEPCSSALVSGRSSVRLRPWAQDQQHYHLRRRFSQDRLRRSCESPCGHRVDMIFVCLFGGPLSLRQRPGWTGMPAQGRTVGFSRGSAHRFVVLAGEWR